MTNEICNAYNSCFKPGRSLTDLPSNEIKFLALFTHVCGVFMDYNTPSLCVISFLILKTSMFGDERGVIES